MLHLSISHLNIMLLIIFKQIMLVYVQKEILIQRFNY